MRVRRQNVKAFGAFRQCHYIIGQDSEALPRESRGGRRFPRPFGADKNETGIFHGHGTRVKASHPSQPKQ
jgi:hypothetical protein